MNENFKERAIAAGIIAAGFVVGLWVYGLVSRVAPGVAQPLRGIDLTQPSFRNTTSTTVACNAASSSNVLPPSTSRLMFQATNNSSQTITLCASSNCVFGSSSLIMNGSHTVMYEQFDSYGGAYSCISDNGTTTLGVTYSQGFP